MSAHNDLVYVRHILRALDKICDYTAHLTVVWTTVEKDVPRLLPLLRAITTQE